MIKFIFLSVESLEKKRIKLKKKKPKTWTKFVYLGKMEFHWNNGI